MTREEYERLLQSDYWKGYSYSLIKERNFTCEDCGRSFPNERNKLQVHHLVYRDANPWSYSPDELVVLCEECHKRRHGINPETEPIGEPSAPSTDSYTRSYSSDYNTSERDIRPRTRSFPVYTPRKKRGRKGFLLFACILAAVLFWGNPDKEKSEIAKSSSQPVKTEAKNTQAKTKKASPVVGKQPAVVSEKASSSKASIAIEPKEKSLEEIRTDAEDMVVASDAQTMVVESLDLPPTIDMTEEAAEEVVKEAEPADESKELTTLEILERKNHEDVVKRARRAGVSTEGSTLDILERINHAEVVKRAERAGVSTEGTTLDILERINHADVVKRAERAGVSTEGTTLDILERMNHADAVKRAERAGVSTEGSTLDILERMNHADVVKRAERAGVSTEGTTFEILERMNHADVVKRAQRVGVSTEGTTMEILDRINKKNLEKSGY